MHKLDEQGDTHLSKGFVSVKGAKKNDIYTENRANCDNMTNCGCPPDNKMCPNTLTCAF